MKLPWHCYLALKQLFPTGRRVSFFSALAIVGVALGVNVIIVVIAFMKGFQGQFRDDLIDTYGEVLIETQPHEVLSRYGFAVDRDWEADKKRIEEDPDVNASTPFMGGFVFLELVHEVKKYKAFPRALGVDVESVEDVLPLKKFIEKAKPPRGYEEVELLMPTIDDLDDETVFVHVSMGEAGVHPPLFFFEPSASQSNQGNGTLKVLRLSPFVLNDRWTVIFRDEETFEASSERQGLEPTLFRLDEGPHEIGGGDLTLGFEVGSQAFAAGDRFQFRVIESSTVEVYGRAVMEGAGLGEDEVEVIPPRELRVAGFFQTSLLPGVGSDFQMICSLRLMGELNGREGQVHGFNVRLNEGLADDDQAVAGVARRLSNELRDYGYRALPWFEINPGLLRILKFEEILMVVIMIPTVLVAAFAIAIALMTSVLRKTREIGLLIAMGGDRLGISIVFCLQGFVIGVIGVLAGWCLACLMIRFRHALMDVIVPIFSDQMTDSPYYQHFSAVKVSLPWESWDIAVTFFWAGLFGVVISTLAGLLPAWKASRLKPAEALRSE